MIDRRRTRVESSGGDEWVGLGPLDPLFSLSLPPAPASRSVERGLTNDAETTRRCWLAAKRVGERAGPNGVYGSY